MDNLNYFTQDDLERFDEEGYLVVDGLFEDDLDQVAVEKGCDRKSGEGKSSRGHAAYYTRR